jgi:excisionase family DNA binding protein
MVPMFCTLKQAADKLGTTEAQIRNMLENGRLREFRDGSRRLLKVADLTDVEIVQRPGSHGGPPAPAARKAKSPQQKVARPSRGPGDSAGPDRRTAGQPGSPSAGEIRLPPTAAATATTSRPRMQPPGQSSHLAHRAPAGQPPHQTVASGAVVVSAQTTRSAAREADEEFPIEDLAYPGHPADTDRRPEPRGSACSSDLHSVSGRPPVSIAGHPAAGRAPLLAPRPRPQTRDMSLRQWLWMGLLDDQPLAILLLFGIIALAIGVAAGAAYLVTQAF